MKYVQSLGMDLSAFCLGTVQLGMDYGINNPDGKPTHAAAFEILDRAAELGVNLLDTANNYGDSEVVVGLWLKNRRAEGRPCPAVVTKIGPLTHTSYDALRDDVYRQVEGCRKNLGVETLDGLMLHAYEDYADDRDNVRRVFEELRREKAYRFSALSAYSRHDYRVIAESGFDATQIPLNLFDWSQIENGGIECLRKAGMTVFVRSVFLQGLVFRSAEGLDQRMDFCVPYLKRFEALCREFALSPAVLALSFALSVPGVTAAVLGCEKRSQVEDNCALIEKTVRLTDEQMEKIHAAFHGIDPRVINPGVWFNHT